MGAAGAKEELLRRDEIHDLEEISGFSGKRILELYKRFIRLDRSGKGSITRADLLAIPELSMNPLVDRITNYFGFAEKSRINFTDFVRILSVFNTQGDPQKMKDLHEAYFSIFDQDEDGFISPKELFSILKNMAGTFISDNELEVMVDIIIEEVDLDGDGKLNFNEFEMAFMRNQIIRTDSSSWRT